MIKKYDAKLLNYLLLLLLLLLLLAKLLQLKTCSKVNQILAFSITFQTCKELLYFEYCKNKNYFINEKH